MFVLLLIGTMLGGLMPSISFAQPFSPINAGLTGVDDGTAKWADFDGDQDLDLVVTGRDFRGNRTGILYENDVSNGNGFPLFSRGIDEFKFSSAAWADYDGDDDPDLVITGESGGRSTILYENDVANGNDFQAVGAGLTGVDQGSSTWGDYDNDGDPDLLVTGLKSGVGFPASTTLYENDVANGNGFQPVNAGLANVKSSASAWGDYDQDNELDLAVAGETTGGSFVTKIYRNDGGGTFTDIQAGLTGVRFSALAWGDLVGDSRPELVVTGVDASGTRTARIYEQTSSGFSPVNAGLTGVTGGSIDIGDYDGDGDNDLVITGLNANGSNSAVIYENKGGGTFSPLGAGLTGVGTGSSQWGDYDGDGDLDLVITGTGTATIYENERLSPGGPSPVASECVTFDDVTAGTQFTPGDQFSSGGYAIEVAPYLTSPSTGTTNGTVTIAANGSSPGTGQEASFNNATIRFDFQNAKSGLTFAYRDAGGTVNLGVNGDRRVASVLNDLDGQTVGGVTVDVRRTSSSNPIRGFVTLRGRVSTVTVGGQEFGVDNVCPGCITFEDLSTGRTLSQRGATVTTGGVPVEVQPFTLSGGGTFFNELVIQDDSLSSFPPGNKAFLNNVVAAPQFSSPQDTVSFRYEAFGGSLNLRVNGDLRASISDFAALGGTTVGGAQVSVRSLPTTGGTAAGVVTIAGSIQDLGIGGQELFVDEICTHGPGDDADGTVFTVTSTGDGSDANPGDGRCATGDDGPCTLRAALQETNALANTGGPDKIHFDIAGAGPHEIRPDRSLPDVTDPVVIDGSTEPDFAGDPVVVLDGEALSRNLLSLENGSAGSAVLDLSFVNSGNYIALFLRTGDHLVDGCWIGLHPNGTVTPSDSWGLRTFGSDSQIGSSSRRGNVIVASGTGLGLAGGASNNTVQNNRIGETPGGTNAGNRTGIALSGGFGAVTDNTIGGLSSNEGNRIAHNERGVRLSNDNVFRNTIRGNRIFDHTGPGIALKRDGQTPNDAGDADDGPNRLQNFPAIATADYAAADNEVTVTYSVPSSPSASGSGASTYPLTVDFYRADAEEDDGERYLHTDTYTVSDYTNGPSTTISFTPEAPVDNSSDIVATATDANGNTSEFSRQSQQLPVELASFDGTQTDASTVALTWTTAGEENNAGFRVQHRSGRDSSWTTLGRVDSRADGGSTTTTRSYRFTAEDLSAGRHRFRLVQTDLDGTEHPRDPISVKVDMQQALRLSAPVPNPVRHRTTISFAVRDEATATLSMYNVLGQRVATLYRDTPPAGTERTVPLSASEYPSGVYFLHLRADGNVTTQRVTIVK